MSQPQVTRLVPQGHAFDASADVYAFGPIRVDVARHVVTRDGQPIALAPKTFELLLIFVRSDGRALSRQELVAALWPDTFVEEANLSFQISTLRRAIGDASAAVGTEAGGAAPWIETVPKVGYRLTAKVIRAPSGRASRTMPVSVAVAAILLVALGLLAAAPFVARYVSVGRTAGVLAPLRYDIPLPPGRVSGYLVPYPFLSPDGRTLLVRLDGIDGFWRRDLSAADGAVLNGTGDGQLCVIWAPDSRRFAYTSSSGALKIVRLSDGRIETLCETCEAGVGDGLWTRDGLIVYPARDGSLRRLHDTGGDPETITRPDYAGGDRHHLLPSLLSDGRRFIFTVLNRDRELSGAFLARLDDTAMPAGGNRLDAAVTRAPLRPWPRVLAQSPVLYRSGFIIRRHAGAVAAQPFDEATLRTSGPPVAILPVTAAMVQQHGGNPNIALSDNGVFVHGRVEHPRVRFTWVDRTGRELGQVGEPGPFRSFDLSSDDRRLAVSTIEEDRASIVTLDLARGSSTRLSFTAAHFVDPRWLDATRVVAVRSTYARTALVRLGPDGEETRIEAPTDCLLDDVAPDGRALACRPYPPAPFSGQRTQLVALALDGSTTPQLLHRVPSAHIDQVEFSPDGRYVAFGSSVTGRPEVYVTRVGAPEQRLVVTTAGGVQPRWRGDGRELFFLDFVGRLHSVLVDVEDDGDLRLSPPTLLFDTRLGQPLFVEEQYAVARDGQRILLRLPADTHARRSIGVIHDWLALARSGLPPS